MEIVNCFVAFIHGTCTSICIVLELSLLIQTDYIFCLWWPMQRNWSIVQSLSSYHCISKNRHGQAPLFYGPPIGPLPEGRFEESIALKGWDVVVGTQTISVQMWSVYARVWWRDHFVRSGSWWPFVASLLFTLSWARNQSNVWLLL